MKTKIRVKHTDGVYYDTSPENIQVNDTKLSDIMSTVQTQEVELNTFKKTHESDIAAFVKSMKLLMSNQTKLSNRIKLIEDNGLLAFTAIDLIKDGE